VPRLDVEPLVELDAQEEGGEGGQLVLVPVEPGRGDDPRYVGAGVRYPPPAVYVGGVVAGRHEPVEERERPARGAPLDLEEVGHLVVPVDHLGPVVVVHRRPSVGPGPAAAG